MVGCHQSAADNSKGLGRRLSPKASSTKTSSRMENKTIDLPLIHQKVKNLDTQEKLDQPQTPRWGFSVVLLPFRSACRISSRMAREGLDPDPLNTPKLLYQEIIYTEYSL